MGKRLPGRDARRKAFLRALAVGATVAAAAQRARIAWSTVYAWRRDEPKFRAAWDRAAGLGEHPLAARVESALFERAVEGTDEPVVRNGAIIGTRKRYSDPLLMLAIASLRERRDAAAPPGPEPAAPAVRLGDVATTTGNITVVVRRFGEEWKAEEERRRESLQAGLTDRAGADPPPRHLAQPRVDP